MSFTMDFDTGSSDMYLPGVTCTQNCRGHKLYNPRTSSSSRDYNQTFEFAFEDDSSVSGEVYQDSVSVSPFTVRTVS